MNEQDSIKRFSPDHVYADRVQRHTSEKANERIARRMRESVCYYASQGEEGIRKRIEDLDHEWDIERVLEVIAPVLSFSGLVFGIRGSRKWLGLPLLVLPFFFQHALQGWCPPLPVLRRFGIRTRSEIDEEKYTLKAMRGDFAHMSTVQNVNEKALQAIDAVKR